MSLRQENAKSHILMGKIRLDVNLPLSSPSPLSEVCWDFPTNTKLHIALKCQGLKLACSSYLMLHNKWPKVNRIEQPFIILTDSGSEFQTGQSRDGLSQFHDVWDPNLRTGRLWGPKSSAELFIHLSSLIGLGLNSLMEPLPMVSPHGLAWASSERGDQDWRVSVCRRKLGVSFIFFMTSFRKHVASSLPYFVGAA